MYRSLIDVNVSKYIFFSLGCIFGEIVKKYIGGRKVSLCGVYIVGS